jgi:hypothetical protein
VSWRQWLRLPVTFALVARNTGMGWLLVELVAWAASFLKPSAWAGAR